MHRFLFFLCLVFLSGCLGKPTSLLDGNQISGDAIEFLLDSTSVRGYTLFATTSVQAIYRGRNYRPLWTEQEKMTPAADSLLRMIQHAAYYGLNPSDYHLDLISDILGGEQNAVSISTADILLTDAFFSFYHHLNRGRLDPASFEPVSVVLPDTTMFIPLLNAIQRNAVIETLEDREPLHGGYRVLKIALAERLNRLGETPGPTLVTQSNDSHAEGIKTIAINMERWRWEKYPLPERFVNVNIPEFALQVVDCDSIVLASRVVVGSRSTQTPLLESVIDCITVYPYWHVPRKISVNELLPIIQRDTAYISRNNFDVLDGKGNIVDYRIIDWKRLSKDHFPYMLRQRDGEENALGIIKFGFDNPFAVYLHDTNAKRYFNVENRALSHGCVRVEKAVQLAHYLVKDDSVMSTSGLLDNYLSLRQRKDLDLLNPVPIRIKYFTYRVANGVITFLEDVYGMDSLMMKALF